MGGGFGYFNEPASIEQIHDHKIFVGVWSNPHYFDKDRKKVLETFGFPKLRSKQNIALAEKIHKTNSVSVHLRMGDYKSQKHHSFFYQLDETDYYQKAISLIKKRVKNPVFFVFSDDMIKTKKFFEDNFLKLNNFHFIDWNTGDNYFRDMQLMSLCKHNIIANSTFSFWVGYLNKNKNKIIIFPRYSSRDRVHSEYCDQEKKLSINKNWVCLS